MILRILSKKSTSATFPVYEHKILPLSRVTLELVLVIEMDCLLCQGGIIYLIIIAVIIIGVELLNFIPAVESIRPLMGHFLPLRVGTLTTSNNRAEFA